MSNVISQDLLRIMRLVNVKFDKISHELQQSNLMGNQEHSEDMFRHDSHERSLARESDHPEHRHYRFL